LTNVKIDFGDTSISRSNGFANALTWMWVEYSKRMIENTAFFFGNAIGEFLYQDMIGSAIDDYIGSFNKKIPLINPIPGLESKSEFDFVYRLTRDPIIENNSQVTHINLNLNGALNLIGGK